MLATRRDKAAARQKIDYDSEAKTRKKKKKTSRRGREFTIKSTSFLPFEAVVVASSSSSQLDMKE